VATQVAGAARAPSAERDDDRMGPVKPAASSARPPLHSALQTGNLRAAQPLFCAEFSSALDSVGLRKEVKVAPLSQSKLSCGWVSFRRSLARATVGAQSGLSGGKGCLRVPRTPLRALLSRAGAGSASLGGFAHLPGQVSRRRKSLAHQQRPSVLPV